MRGRCGVLVVALTAALAACSSSSTTSAPSSTSTTSTAKRPSGPPLKIMLIYEKSDGISSPDLPDGATAAVDAINAHGGVKDRPIQLEVCDTHNDPNAAADCANKAVADGVVASVGNISQQSAGYFPILANKKIPVIGESPATATAFTSPIAFPVEGGAVSNFAALGRFVADKGAKTISLIRPDIAAGGIAKGFVDQGLKPLGRAVKNDVAVPLDAPDMTPYAEQALAGGSDGLVIALTGTQAANVIQAAKQINPDVKIGLIASNLDQVLQSLGADAHGVVLADYLIPPNVKTSGTTSYTNEMNAAGFKNLGGVRPLSWLAVHAFADVAKTLPTVTGAALIAKLSSTTGLVTGVTPPLQWVHGGVAGIPRVFSGCMYGTEIDSNGSERPLSGSFFDAFANKACETPK